MDNRSHWDKVFEQKQDDQKSWFEAYPSTSMAFIEELHLAKTDAIIDVGGGDSRLADALLEKGYTDITVLDISDQAIHNAQKRLGDQASRVQWIVTDILNFAPTRQYACWHDRAVFHFVTQADNIHHYTGLMADTIPARGALILGTFAEDGPDRCSGLPVQRYSQEALIDMLASAFQKVRCIHETHETPFHTVQAFTFCRFSRRTN